MIFALARLSVCVFPHCIITHSVSGHFQLTCATHDGKWANGKRGFFLTRWVFNRTSTFDKCQTHRIRGTHRSMNENSTEIHRQTMRNGMHCCYYSCTANSYRSKVDLLMHQNSVWFHIRQPNWQAPRHTNENQIKLTTVDHNSGETIAAVINEHSYCSHNVHWSSMKEIANDVIELASYVARHSGFPNLFGAEKLLMGCRPCCCLCA